MARTTVVTEKYVAKICDDIGTCWHDLGTELDISLEILSNIESDYNRSREKAKAMLNCWIKTKGRCATVQRLIDALNKIGQRRIAEKLLGNLQTPRDELDGEQHCSSRTNENQSIPNTGGNYGNSCRKMEGKMATESNSKLTSNAMDEKHRNILKRVKLWLVKDMDPEEVLLQMSSALVFSEREEETIRAEKTRESKCEKLLSILPRKGAAAYRSFLQALKEVQTHLAILILEAEIQEIDQDPTSEPHSSVELPAPGSQPCSGCRQLQEKYDLEMEAMKQKFAEVELKHKNEVEQYKKEAEQYKKEIDGLKKVATPQKKREEVLKKAKKRDPKR